MKDYYEILGVLPDSNLDEIKTAYRKKARKFHPDTSQCDSIDDFLQIQEAYETLCEHEKRECYDKACRVAEDNWFETSKNQSNWEAQDTNWNFIQNDVITVSDKSERNIEDNAYLEIILTSREARTGTAVPLNIPLSYTCPFCLGTGEIFFDFCSNCNGSGKKTILREIYLRLPGGLRDGSHILADLFISKKRKIRLNILIKISKSTSIFTEIP